MTWSYVGIDPYHVENKHIVVAVKLKLVETTNYSYPRAQVEGRQSAN